MYLVIKSLFYSLIIFIIITFIFACTKNENEAVSKEIYPCDRDHILFDRPLWSKELSPTSFRLDDIVDNQDYIVVEIHLGYYIISKKDGEFRVLRPPIFSYRETMINDYSIFFSETHTAFNDSRPPLYGFIAYDLLTLEPKELKPEYFLNLGVESIVSFYIFANEYYIFCKMLDGDDGLLKYDDIAHEFKILHRRKGERGRGIAVFRKSDASLYILYLDYYHRGEDNPRLRCYAVENADELDYEIEIDKFDKSSLGVLYFLDFPELFYLTTTGMGIINYRSKSNNDDYTSTFFDYETGKILYHEDGRAFPLNEHMSLMMTKDPEEPRFVNIQKIFNHFTREKVIYMKTRWLDHGRGWARIYKDNYFISNNFGSEIVDIETGCGIGTIDYNFSGPLYILNDNKSFISINFRKINMFKIPF